jgi:lanosterol synthase
MVWSPVTTAQVVIARYAVGRPHAAAERDGLLRHFDRWQRPDGGHPLHPAAGGSLYVTALCWAAMRLLGRPEDDPRAQRALGFVGRTGGPGALPAWGRLWLALLGLYPWDGVPPLVPELWLLPRWLPAHPSRLYCHTRFIYLAMSVLWARRFRPAEDETLGALRAALYPGGYEAFARTVAGTRDRVSPVDLHRPVSRLTRALYAGLRAFERVHPAAWRERALAELVERIAHEQAVSRQASVSPVNGALNVVALRASDPDHRLLTAAVAGLESWRHDEGADGIWYAGARSDTWDTAFALQGLVASGAAPAAALTRAADALLSWQVREDAPLAERFDRSRNRGGFCFSDGQHVWPVSDCTAEALEALALGAPSFAPPRDAVEDAVGFLLSRQNRDGGFATYEEQRGPRWLELLNPAEMFADCMVDRSYVECTGSSVRGLLAARALGVDHPPARRAIARGERFLRRAQRPDGAWPGAWGVCFLYGTFHAARALAALAAPGATNGDPALRRAGRWLRGVQNADGGFGEDGDACRAGRFLPAPSDPVQTAWGLLAALACGADDAARRAAAWLVARQHTDGTWPAARPTGVFMQTALLDYRLYRATFPLWALTAWETAQAARAARADERGRS